MLRSQMLDQVSTFITAKKFDHPTLVAIDGFDAAGKTRLSKELVFPLRRKSRQVVTVSLDDFQNPTQIRYRRGRNSPEGYYYDSFNYDAFIGNVLKPLRDSENRRIRRTLFSISTNMEVNSDYESVAEDAIVLCDGIFLMRPELMDFWDITIFVDITLDTALQRVVEREIRNYGSYETIKQMYEQRYFAGQKIYFDRCHPYQRADLIIDNNDIRNPLVIEQHTIA